MALTVAAWSRSGDLNEKRQNQSLLSLLSRLCGRRVRPARVTLQDSASRARGRPGRRAEPVGFVSPRSHGQSAVWRRGWGQPRTGPTYVCALARAPLSCPGSCVQRTPGLARGGCAEDTAGERWLAAWSSSQGRLEVTLLCCHAVCETQVIRGGEGHEALLPQTTAERGPQAPRTSLPAC